MPLFSAKLDYALRAVVDLAAQAPGRACQSRDIALRQGIRGPYLDQILAILKRDGIVRSIRGAGGGYTLAASPSRLTVGQVVRAVTGDNLLVGPASQATSPDAPGSAFAVRQFEEQAERQLRLLLDSTTLADLLTQKQRLDDAMSIMPGI